MKGEQDFPQDETEQLSCIKMEAETYRRETGYLPAARAFQVNRKSKQYKMLAFVQHWDIAEPFPSFSNFF